MANNPIDTNSFQHFLLIRGVEYEIQEPVNFDKSNFKCEQNNYARDTFYGNEESLLEFYQNYGSQGQTFVNNDGILISHLPSGLDLLLQENKNNGSESDVKYILKKDGLEFTTGNFDFSTAETDNNTYFKSKIIQNTNNAKIKKREKINIDLLSTKDLDDNTIDAIPLQRMLLKAKPLYGESKFSSPTGFVNQNLFAGGGGGISNEIYYYYNMPQQVDLSEIENTLSFLDILDLSFGAEDFAKASNFGFIDAKEDLSNIKVNITDLFFSQTTDVDEGGNGYVGTQFNIVWGFDIANPIGIIRPIDYNLEEYQNFAFSQDLEYIIPFIPKGAKLWIYFRSRVVQSAAGGIPFQEPKFEAFTTLSAYNIKISATSTAIDRVINAVRWIDLIKQTYKGIGSLPVDANKFDVGGEYYDNFCFNKNLIRKITDKPFNVTLSDVVESLGELNCDSQINNDKIYIGNYGNFYENIDIGGFLEVPEYESNFSKNERYLVNEFVYGYEKFEQDRNERNTIDAIHTNSEWFPQVQNSINKKELKLPFIRDPFAIEVAAKSILSIKNNSDNTDDNIFIVDVVPLAPNTRKKFTRFLAWQVNGFQAKILTDNTFTWTSLGFIVGDTIKVNGTNRQVIAMTDNILTISYFFVGVQNNASFVSFDYPLTNVLYTNRTNEGLTSFSNLRKGDNFSNLRYSIKRNIKTWFPVLATYGKFIPTKKLKNTLFKANGECTTQFTGEPLAIKENEDILISDISSYKILNQDIYKTRVICSFEKALQLLNDIQNVRGFVRVQSTDGSIVKGYIKESNYIWSSGELDLELECKNESDFLTITYNAGILTINEVGYSEKQTNIKLYNIFNDYIQFFDINNVNLCNRTFFDKVLLNGVSYSSVTDLVNAIELL